MKKIIVVLLGFIVSVSVVAVYFYLTTSSYIGPCNGYKEVGEFNQKISSEDDSKRIALDYFKSIGYNFKLEDFTAKKINDDWSISYYPAIDSIGLQKLCIGSANPPQCIGQELRLKEALFWKNKILMEYQIPC